MASLPLTVNALHKTEMEYHGKFWHTLAWIQQISPMIRINIYYTDFHMETQTVAPNITGFQGIKRCIQYLDSHPNKPIFYPYKYYDGSNLIRLTWSFNQVEDYTTQKFYNAINMRIMIEFSTEDGQFQVLFMLSLVFISDWKYIFNHLWPLTPLVDKLDVFTRLSIKLRLSGDTRKP